MRRWRLILAIVVPLALALVIAALVLGPRLTVMNRGMQVTPSIIVHLPSTDTTRLEKALSSPELTVQASIMVPELARAYVAHGQPAFPKGSTVKILQNTSVCKGRICQVKSVVIEPKGRQLTFLLYLVKSAGRWLVFGTNIGMR